MYEDVPSGGHEAVSLKLHFTFGTACLLAVQLQHKINFGQNAQSNFETMIELLPPGTLKKRVKLK